MATTGLVLSHADGPAEEDLEIWLNQLEQQVQELRAQRGDRELEGSREPVERQDTISRLGSGAVACPPAPIENNGVQVKAHSFIKLDSIYDFHGVGNPDPFVTSSIPARGGGDENFEFHAKQSRIGVEILNHNTNSRAALQVDWFNSSDGYKLNLRHVYFQMHRLYAGYGFSNFMN